jgi:hypothetical protein
MSDDLPQLTPEAVAAAFARFDDFEAVQVSRRVLEGSESKEIVSELAEGEGPELTPLQALRASAGMNDQAAHVFYEKIEPHLKHVDDFPGLARRAAFVAFIAGAAAAWESGAE